MSLQAAQPPLPIRCLPQFGESLGAPLVAAAARSASRRAGPTLSRDPLDQRLDVDRGLAGRDQARRQKARDAGCRRAACCSQTPRSFSFARLSEAVSRPGSRADDLGLEDLLVELGNPPTELLDAFSGD